MRLWGIVRKNQKISAQSVSDVAHAGVWNENNLHDALDVMCHELDLSRPVVLYKHAQEMNKFSRTTFHRADFMESVDFDTFEIELIDEAKKKEKNRESENY